MRYTQRIALLSRCCSRTTLAVGPTTSWNSCSSERQKPWQVRAAAQIGQWSSISSQSSPSASTLAI